MPPCEKFSTKGLEGAPRNDIGWHFGTPVPNTKGDIICKLYGKVVKGGITRFKEHIAHKTGNVTPCPNVTCVIRECMMNILKENKTKKIDKKRRKDEFLSQLREDQDQHEEFIDEVFAIRQATRESIQSQHEWHRREEFRQSTGGWNNIYEEGRSSHGSAKEYHRERTSKSIPSESEFTLRGAILELVRSKSSKQAKVNDSFLKSFRRKIGEAVFKFLIYERLPFQLASSPWLYNLIQESTEVGQGVKLPTPYEVFRCVFGVRVSTSCFLNPQFQFGVKHSENVLIETLEGTRLVIERLELSLDSQVRMVNQLLLFKDKQETFCAQQAQRAWKQMNPDGENVGVLPVDTSDDEMDVDQSQQQNLSHSSSSSTPSQSGDGPDGGGLSPIDEDDRFSGDRGEIRSSSRYGEEYGVGTTSGHFRDKLEFDGNMFLELRKDRSELRTPSKGKCKKHTFVGSSSGRRSSSSNLGYSDLSTSTQGFYPPEQPSYFQPSHDYPQPYEFPCAIPASNTSSTTNVSPTSTSHTKAKRIKSRTLSK
ncbi:hypothetical protein GOBAR_AA01686 [Gossypium barbadense]|uniref:BED-type domain-containing protein n=1 Tax=Gossypium barbadense TaxID=3634 RepID=A0A2P5YTH6_GOSBA|nr:hypothetical protein GOBAR_AA01686 [Gossypium barbadense]